MKTLAILFSALALTANAVAETNDNDTVVVENPSRVTVVTTDSIQSIRIEGKKDDSSFNYQSKIELTDSNYTSTTAINSSDFTYSIGPISNKKKDSDDKADATINFYVGFNGAPGMPQSADTRLLKSWELGFTVSYNFWWPWKAHTPFYFSAGAGLFWRSWRMTDDKLFARGADGQTIIANYPEGVSPKFSRIKVLSLSFPLMAHYVCHGTTFSLGPVVNFNVKSSIKTKWKVDDVESKQYIKDIHATPVTVDFMATFETHSVGIYAKYSPCDMLDGKYGLKYKTFSIGLFL